MKDIGIGLLGFGTVGASVIEGLRNSAALIAARTGATLVLRKVAVRDLSKDRSVEVDHSMLTQDAESVVTDPDIDVVVELIGGTSVSRIRRMIRRRATNHQ